MSSDLPRHLIVRRLTSSDLGWFAEPRRLGATRSKQRAININADIVDAVLPESLRKCGELTLDARCVCPGAFHTEPRILAKVHKNWRLGGKAVPGDPFRKVQSGDFFLGVLHVVSLDRVELIWTVCMRARDAQSHDQLLRTFGADVSNGMTSVSEGSDLFVAVCRRHLPDVRVHAFTNPIQADPQPSTAQSEVVPPIPAPTRPASRSPSIKDRVRQPHVLAQMLAMSTSMSAQSQAEFLQVLEALATELRTVLRDAGLITSVQISHSRLWKSVSGVPVAFVDGGMANLSALGAAPLAVRVGSYVVTPGDQGNGRERFEFERQLVDELFEPSRGREGLFADVSEDLGRLRDVARISLEAAGSISVAQRLPRPKYVFMHGALVNPTSMYEGVPAFSSKGIGLLLPNDHLAPTGRDAHFISVYRQLLHTLRQSGATVAGVVERESTSIIVASGLLDALLRDKRIDSTFHEQANRRMREYRVTDALLFDCILDEGDYVRPVEVDRNEMRRAAREWMDVIQEYPRPWISYLKPSEWSLPIRVEMFADPPAGVHATMDLLLHSSRLLPRYAFPAGLDIVDKHAKIPAWMSRPINSYSAALLMRRALESENPMLINEARRLLCGNARDWLFRPSFRGSA